MPIIDDTVLQEANRLAQKTGRFGFVSFQGNNADLWDYDILDVRQRNIQSGQTQSQIRR